MSKLLGALMVIAAVSLAEPQKITSNHEQPVPGTICGDPGKVAPCRPFHAADLPFVFPQDEVARDEFSSEPFYAVILKSVPRCSVGESDRLQIQELFPQHKVFASRMGCDDEAPITYTNVNADFGFIAVYGGRTRPDARKVLLRAGETGRFPGANIRKMRAVLVYP